MEREEIVAGRRKSDKIAFFKGMRGTLSAWFLILALTPMVVVSIVSYYRAQAALTAAAREKLLTNRELKQRIFHTLLKRWEAEIRFVANREILKSDMADLAAGFNFIGAEQIRSLYLNKPELTDAGDGSAYSAVHKEERAFFESYARIQEYEDIFLINTDGDVIFTLYKKAYFGASLVAGPDSGSNLAALYKKMQAAGSGEVTIQDAGLYGDGVAMFMGIAVERGATRFGYLVFSLPLKALSERMGEREGMGRSGETFLVGQDYRLRTDTFNDPVNRSLRASLAGTVTQNGVDTEAARNALAGKKGIQVVTDYRGVGVLSAYAPLDIKDFRWAILSELDIDEALAPAKALGRITLGLSLLVALAVLVLSFIASGRIVSPIQKLTDWARNVASGDLSIIDIRTPGNEIGVLNQSLREAVKSLQLAHKEGARQGWFSKGRSDLDDRMRGERGLQLLCRDLITFAANYLGASVGAFFINDGTGVFHLTGSYAYQSRKNLINAFATGEGLVGQAALERQSILLTRVPEDYVSVSSGLGEKAPRNILVVPLVFNEETVGVMELGSFDPFTEDQLVFLKEAAERIAVVLNSARNRETLKKALEKTQQQAEELQTQQEELKAANEEMEAHTMQLQASEQRLKEQQEELKATNEELEEKTQALEIQKARVDEKNSALQVIQKDLKRQTVELETAGRYKTDFLANMSHELRTPLNSLLILAQDLASNRGGNLDADQVESAGLIFNSGQDLLNLINEILDLAKIEAGRMDIHPEPVALTTLAQALRAQFTPLVKNKGLSLAVEIAETLPAEVVTDAQRTGQILRNLVGNAIKFTDTGGVTVSFRRPATGIVFRRSDLTPQRCIAIAVADTGIGIAEDSREVVFEAFRQLHGGTSRAYSGTGLGLTISREMAVLLGGEIHVESTPGSGATFTLYLPEMLATAAEAPRLVSRKKPAAPPAPAPAAPAHASATIDDDRELIASGDRVILVVEDDTTFARVLYRFCHERNWKCIHAGDGETGLCLARTHRPDAIILDIRLPGIPGWEVLDRLKQNAETRHIPVHVMTVEDRTVDAFQRGAVGFLQKPLSREDLDGAFERITSLVERGVKKLLVVEDDPVIQKTILELIGNGDVISQAVATGREALEALAAEVYDCVILDLKLPDMDGFEVLERLNAVTDRPVPPVIVYTGRDITREEEYRLGEYAASIIVKGVKSQERLLDETALFLHRVIEKMPPQKQKMIAKLYNDDGLFEGKRILLVDDDMRNAFAVSKILEDRGMHVVKAADGQKALDVLVGREPIDLVLMDIMMPVMDGYTAMRRIRAMEKFTALPIIALTAKAMSEDRRLCIDAGANDYLAKPVDMERLLSLMRVWLYR